MAAPAPLTLTDTPRYVTTAGFGCIFSNYGTGSSPGPPQHEPDIITKFFGTDSDTSRESKSYEEEKTSHYQIKHRCGKFAEMPTIFGIDLNIGLDKQVKGYGSDINVKSVTIDPVTGATVTGIKTISRVAPYLNVSPTMVCEIPNYQGAKLSHKVFSKDNAQGIPTMYPVIKMRNLGKELYESPANLYTNSFIQIMEVLALFHTGMIHNDIKGNNMLVNPLTRKVALIDFGLCTPFDSAASKPPYYKRTIEYLQQSWFAYPPEYSLLGHTFKYFERPQLALGGGIDPYVQEYINTYKGIRGTYNWPYLNIFDRTGTETSADRDMRIHNTLTNVYNDYLAPHPSRPNPMVFLQTAITGDTFTIGLEYFFLYGLNPVRPPPSIDNTPVKIGGPGPHLSGSGFTTKVAILLTCMHPRVRPFHINVLKLYKFYNRARVVGATTVVYIKAADGVNHIPYCELSILNGVPARILVDPGMALGSEGCPITLTEVSNNLAILYYLLQKNVGEINSIINDTHLIYANLLNDANAYVTANMPSLFVYGPNLPPAPAGVRLGPPAAQPPPPPGPPPPGARQVPPGPPRPPLYPVAPPRLGAPGGGSRTVGGANPVEFVFVDTNTLFSGGSVHGPNALRICVTADSQVVKNVMEAGLFSFGAYSAALKAMQHEEISEIMRSRLTAGSVTNGGVRVTPSVSSVRSLRNKSIRNKAKQSSVQKSVKKLNTTLRKNTVKLRRTGNMPNYSDLQVECTFNDIMTSTAGGKLNILHSYYIRFFPAEQQALLMRLLFYIPLADPAIIRKIMATDNLVPYLTDLKNTHMTQVNTMFRTGDVEQEINDIVNTFLSMPDESRYGMLLDIFDRVALDSE